MARTSREKRGKGTAKKDTTKAKGKKDNAEPKGGRGKNKRKSKEQNKASNEDSESDAAAEGRASRVKARRSTDNRGNTSSKKSNKSNEHNSTSDNDGSEYSGVLSGQESDAESVEDTSDKGQDLGDEGNVDHDESPDNPADIGLQVTPSPTSSSVKNEVKLAHKFVNECCDKMYVDLHPSMYLFLVGLGRELDGRLYMLNAPVNHNYLKPIQVASTINTLMGDPLHIAPTNEKDLGNDQMLFAYKCQKVGINNMHCSLFYIHDIISNIPILYLMRHLLLPADFFPNKPENYLPSFLESR